MKKYNPIEIELKWQKIWEDQKTFAASDPSASSGQVNSTKPKWYSLIEFPYPSGAGMHVGHIRSNTAMDIISRKRRMEGYNVLYPMGWDAFGLPTENYAIKTGISPQDATKQNTDTFRRQLKAMGYSFDWSREINTTDPNYYKWTQWIFQQFFKQGLAYKAESVINWCPKDKTGLANEEVVGGKCERCGTAVEQRQKEQWMLKITAYADKLLDGLKEVDYLPEIKAQQENWIGRSEGAEIDFKLKTKNDKQEAVRVFTTRPETLFGATYLVLAPEHEIVASLKSQISNWEEVEKYIAETKNKTELERASEAKDPSAGSGQGKTGVELKGVKAVNPATKEEIPVWIGDYVLATYGTGAIMAVPAHDERDFEFAKKFNLPVKEAIEPMIRDTAGKDAVRPGLSMKKRDCVICVVKHWEEDKYLCLRWKKMPWKTFVVGGINEGEDIVQAGLRELTEESGYTDAKFMREIRGAVRSQFYHELKNENRDGRYRGLYFELQSGNQKELAQAEKEIHDLHWLSRKEVDEFLTSDDFRIIWARLFNDVPYVGSGILINSGKFDGMPSEEVKKAITEFVGGKTAVKYKLRDWVFSRQRYWGEPIPLVFCPNCAKNSNKLQVTSNKGEEFNPGWILLPEDELPLELPQVTDYHPTENGESPLASLTDWVNTICPRCSGPATRETDTMPNWAGSSWYYLGYLMSKDAFKSPVSLATWNLQLDNYRHFMPVNWYNGGMEHVTLHLLYSRFWNLFLYDQGLVPTKEPYKKRTAHGMILASDGKKMSKSLGNVVNPDDLVKEFGADALRLYEMFIGPFNQAVTWDQRGILGTARFLERVWKIGDAIAETDNQQLTTDSGIQRLLHKTIKKVGEDIESMNFNTAVSAMMIFVNELSIDKLQISSEDWGKFLKILSPFAPHIAEELNEELRTKNSGQGSPQSSVLSPQLVCLRPWPTFDASLLVEDNFDMTIQVNGKTRGRVVAPIGIDKDAAEKLALDQDEVKKWISGAPKKVIYVPNRLINFIV